MMKKCVPIVARKFKSKCMKFPLLLLFLAGLWSCQTQETNSNFIEVVGEAYEKAPTDGPLRANVYFNGNEKQAEAFRDWFDQAVTQEVQLQSENIYYNNYMEQPEMHGYNLNLSYWVTFASRTDYETFKASMLDKKVPASINLLFDVYGRQPRPNESALLQAAIDDAKAKIKELTGMDEPFIISVAQVPLETYQEHYPEGQRRIQVKVKARLK